MTKNLVEYREDWDKKAFPPSKATEGAGDKGSQTPAPQITDNVEGQYYTGEPNPSIGTDNKGPGSVGDKGTKEKER